MSVCNKQQATLSLKSLLPRVGTFRDSCLRYKLCVMTHIVREHAHKSSIQVVMMRSCLNFECPQIMAEAAEPYF